MIHSMTGYALEHLEVDGLKLSVELRSINSRFLDLSFRIPDELRMLEPAIREVLNAKLGRGKVECRVNYRRAASSVSVDSVAQSLNDAQIDALAVLQQRVLEKFPSSKILSVGEILRWPGVLAEETLPVDALAEKIGQLADAACVGLLDSRAREGEKLVGMMMERVVRMRELVADVAPRIPQIVSDYQEKLITRLREAVATLEEDRVRQEMVIFAQRIDVAEEISRLTAHLDEIERVLHKGGMAGKRLDFLMQELNREANTLGSKSAANDTSKTAMELKVLIEQMREQVQNIV